MNDSIPPVPPSPQHPGNPVPEGYAPPQYAPRPPAGYPSLEQSPLPNAVYTKAPRGLDPEGPGASGFRTAAGVVGIVCGVWFLVPSIAGFQNGGGDAFMAFLILVAALGNATAGIVLLVNRRQRGRRAPRASLGFAGFAMALGLIGTAVPYYGAALLVSAVALAAPVLIITGIGLAKEKRGL